MSQNPASILFNTDGYELPLKEGVSVSLNQPGLLIGAKDSNSNNFKFLKSTNDALSVSQKPSKNILGRYFSNSGLITGAASTQNLLSIENPSGSGKSVYITQIDVNGSVSAVSSVSFLYNITRTSSLPSSGTILSSQKRKTTDTSPSAIIRENPTATASSGSIWSGFPGFAVTGFESRSKNNIAFCATDEDYEILLLPGEGLLVNVGSNSIDWKHFVNIRWCEV